MQAGFRHRTRGVLLCLAASAMLACAAVSAAFAASDYEVDIQGALQITDPPGSGGAAPVASEPDVSYRVIFQYQEPGTAAGPQGLSFLDRVAQVTDGKFEIQGLRGNKVYRVTVERVTFSPAAPGGAIRELIPLDIPPDFFLQAPVSPEGGTPPTPVEVDLALGSPSRADSLGRALSFLYNGKDVMMAALTEAPPVS